MLKRCSFLSLLLFFLSPAFALESVVLQLKWTHQFQFAGYYMAVEKGFYERAGLDVSIIPADVEDPDTHFKVLSGQAHFGVTHSGILAERLQGKPLVAIAAILQSSPYCWMVKADSDIYNPIDFKGKRVSHLGVAELTVMLAQAGIGQDDISLYAGFEPIADFKAGKFDALQVYTSNEPFEMQQQGIAIRQICPKQYGLNLYADILFTSENVLQHRPELVEKFKLASLQGWRYAMLHLQESIELTHQKYATHKSIEQIAYEADKLRPYISPPGVTIGNMSELHWRWIGQIYGLDMAQYDSVRERFIYELKQPEPLLPWSWMLIAAFAVTLISIPLYLHLIFTKKRRYKLNESEQENENEVE